jgi:hypothetical protein
MNLAGNNGYPDRMFMYQGRVLFIEFKQLKGHTQFLQTYRHGQLRKEGFKVEVIYDYDYAIRVLKAFMAATGVPEKGHAAAAPTSLPGVVP